MSERPTLHPDKDLLVAFGLGRLEPNEATTVETHLEECTECCETLFDLKDDTFVALLRQSREPASIPDAQSIRDAGTDAPATERTDGRFDDGSFDATIVLPSGPARGITELPAELADHPRYRLVELIGRGGMGDVYKAEHRLMNRSVALKVINQEFVRNAQAVERFRREVQAAARLTHPNIVTAHDAEQAGNVHYLVMEYVDGTNLSEVVNEHGPLSISQACEYIAQAAVGLQHAHEQGMVHRDVKPHNLMVTSEGQVKILDFGLATLADPALGMRDAGCEIRDAKSDSSRSPASRISNPESRHLTTAGTIMGTPDFISPEQASDARSVDIRSDVYSLGCTLYYLLTGRPPFDEGSVMDRVKAHTDHDAAPIQSVRVDVPDDLAEVIRRMMAKDPAERFQSPADVANALAPFVDQHRTTRRESTPAAQSSRGAGRLRWPIIAAILTPLLIGLGGIIYVATDSGTLVIESDDENVEIIISRVQGDTHEGFQIKVVDRVTGSEVVRLPSGHYRLVMDSNTNVDLQTVRLSKEQFVLSRGGRVIVRVTRKASPAAADIARDTDGTTSEPIARAETRTAFFDLVEAAREATTDDEWKTVIAAHTPVLFDLPQEGSRGLIELLAELPKEMHETLLQQGYLRWKASSLDEERHAAVRGIFSALLSHAPNAPEQPDENQIRERLNQSDVGFVVLKFPDSTAQAVAWYLLDRQHSVPVILLLSGSSVAAIRTLHDPAVRQQVTALQEKPHSDIPPHAVARPETEQALQGLLAEAPIDATDDEWKAFLGKHAPPLQEFPAEISRELIGLMTGLPEESRESLLQDGYLKWRFKSLDPDRQTAMKSLLKQVLTEGAAHAGLDEATVDRVTSMLATADVGFAVLNFPDPAAQVVVWYAQMLNSPIPMMLPISGASSENEKAILSRSVYKQLSEIEDKPYSALPPAPITRAETRQAFDDLVDAARRASTDDDWEGVMREHAPLLPATDEAMVGGSEAFGEAEMAHDAEGGRGLVALLADLPDDVHEELLQTGYLKWRFASLDESRQGAMTSFLTKTLLSAQKFGFPASLKEQAPRMLATGDVGFAVLNLPEAQGQVVAWYLLKPDSRAPTQFSVFRTGRPADRRAANKFMKQQLTNLEGKPHSDLSALLHSTDMERLQGEWRFVRGVSGGEPVSPRQLEIAGNVWLMKDPATGRTVERMTFEIDPTQDLKHMTLSNAALPRALQAIYRFVDDELHMAAPAAPTGERPTRFDEEDESLFYVVMRRQPPVDRQRMQAEAALKAKQERSDDEGRIPFAVWESDGNAAVRFASWNLVFEGVIVDPGLVGLGSFRVPREGIDDSRRSGGGATYWSGKSQTPHKITVDDRIVDGKSTVSVNDVQFEMQGRAETLTFGETIYTASDNVQTLVIRADGTTLLRADEPTPSVAPESRRLGETK